MTDLTELFENNRAWAAAMVEDDPHFFESLIDAQTPKYLWIGCSDSRVPANEIVGLPPGEVFVHRNIANVVVHSDLNCLSVLQYAVEVLRVHYVIVCGHYGCGGISAALSEENHGLIDNWLNHIRDVHRLHRPELDEIDDAEGKSRRLCELNVIEQVRNVAGTTIVRDAWRAGQGPEVHGWIYDIYDGLLRPMCRANRDTNGLELNPNYTDAENHVHA